MTRDSPAGRPLVSAVVPAYNAEAYLGRTIDSLLAQTYPNVEIIIVDDGSSDRTFELAHRLASQHPHVFAIRQGNAGVAAARNAGILQARGRFIAPVDADDIWYPDAMEQLLQRLLSSGEDVGVAYAWFLAIDANGALDGYYRASRIEGDVAATLVCHNFIGTASATLIRRECFEIAGFYNTQFHSLASSGCEDWDLYLRIAEHYQFRAVPRFLVGYRKTPQSMSARPAVMLRSQELMLRLLCQRRHRVRPALLRWSRCSFSLYLACEAYRGRQYRQSRKLLHQALKASVLMAIVRPTTARLLFANTWHGLLPMCPRPAGSVPRRHAVSLASIERRRWSREAKIRLELTLHWLVTWLDPT